MNRSIVAAVCLAGVLITGACSSSSDSSTASKGPNQNANGASNTISNGDKISAPDAADANSNTVATGEEGQIISPLANKRETKQNAIRNSTEPIDNAKAEEMARKTARPAPDDSIFYSFLTDAGYEVREFRNNPQITKAEKRIGADKQTIKIYLAGGRVVEVPGNAVPTMASASIVTILKAAGVTAKFPTEKVAPATGPGKNPGQ